MKLKEKIKSHKKIAAVIIAAALVLSVAGGFGVATSVGAKNIEEEVTVSTVPVTVENLEKTLSATGALISAEESSVASTTEEKYPVAEIYVKIGDVVKKGDPLYRLDMTAFEEQMEYKKKEAALAEQSKALEKADAAREYENAKSTAQSDIDEANRNLTQAQSDAQNAIWIKQSAEQNLESAKSAENEAKKKLDKAKEKDDDEKKIEELKAKYAAATKAREDAESALAEANAGIDTTSKAVVSAQAAVDTANKTAGNTVESQANAVKSAAISAESEALTKEQENKKNEEELAKAVVYATQDGTVTNINIKVGVMDSGADSVVIDDVNHLKATCDIDEAEISKVQCGQRVQIKTDATGEEILQGTVTFVSPTPTKNSSTSSEGESSTASVSKSRATYRVDVDIEGTNDVLRLGMTAKMTFIIESAENVLAVPSATIKLAEDGSSYVTVMNDDGTTEDITIETGMENEYYTEITSSTLTEGMNVVEDLSGEGDAALDGMDAAGGIVIE
ncbi:MAG: efflux RND transporter periplasmic adaptor subunit [Lachnospiraceae bacterium]|nr:efflux RND transporter periplasmic adaptor subunit [Lachnospiraceae bacterium]